MRVLVVHPSFYIYGGAELLVVRLCNYLSGKGIKNSILTLSMLPEIKADLKDTGVILAKVKPFDVIGQIMALRQGVTENQDDFDLINVHNFPAELTAFRCPKPVVWMCNEPELHLSLKLPGSFRYKTFMRALLPFEGYVVRRHIKQVVVADEFNARRFNNLYGITPEIIHYGIDCDFFISGEPEKARRELGLGESFVVLQAGMLTPLKNQMESIRTLKELVGKIPGVKLVLAGADENEYGRMLKGYVRESNLGGRVLFAGHLSRERLRDLMHASDVLLHPIKEQGGWLSPFEALCAGLPVVVSEEMTASEIVRKEGIGIVTEDYAGAIYDVYKYPEKYKKLALIGKKFVSESLSWDAFCAKMVEMFLKAQTLKR